MADIRTDDQKAQDANKMLGILAQIRLDFEPMIDNILTYINHSRRKISDKDGRKGQKTGIDVYDGTALGALNLLTDGMYGYMIAPSLKWFAYMLPGKLNFPRWSGMRAWSGKRMDEYPDVKEWLSDSEEVMYAAYLRSNFYDISPEYLRDGASVGTVTLVAEEDLTKGRTIFVVPHFRECYIAEDRFGMVDTNYRVYNLTLRQLADKFGYDKMIEIDSSFRQSYEKNFHAEKEILHVVYPRKDRDPNIINSKNKPFASEWYLRSPLKLIEEGGYDENPSITWRWRKNNDELYGRSPAWDVYVDVMKANQQAKTNLIAAHKMVEPPMVAPADLRGKIQSGPKGYTWMDVFSADKVPRPLLTGIQLPFALAEQERTEKFIKEHFHVDFFLLLSQAAFNKVELTATQVLEMQGEKAAILGTRVGRLQSEFLNPIHDRMFSIEMRAGRIPPPPQILADYAGASIEVDYLGPLAQAQKRLFKSQGILAGVEAIAPIVNSFGPQVADVINVDETVRELLEARGFPPKCFNTEDKVKEIRGLRLKKEESIQTAELAAKIGKAFPGVSKPIEAGSPVDLLLGGGAGGKT
jgi:hypothetical protein